MRASLCKRLMTETCRHYFGSPCRTPAEKEVAHYVCNSRVLIPVNTVMSITNKTHRDYTYDDKWYYETHNFTLRRAHNWTMPNQLPLQLALYSDPDFRRYALGLFPPSYMFLMFIYFCTPLLFLCGVLAARRPHRAPHDAPATGGGARRWSAAVTRAAIRQAVDLVERDNFEQRWNAFEAGEGRRPSRAALHAYRGLGASERSGRGAADEPLPLTAAWRLCFFARGACLCSLLVAPWLPCPVTLWACCALTARPSFDPLHELSLIHI